MVELRADPFPSNAELSNLWVDAWGEGEGRDFAPVLSRSLVHIGAYHDGKLIGFVNVAWDGGVHGFILDTCVLRQWRRKGVATQLVEEAVRLSRKCGLRWLHVDFEPHLAGFYSACGFQNTNAGLIQLNEPGTISEKGGLS